MKILKLSQLVSLTCELKVNCGYNLSSNLRVGDVKIKKALKVILRYFNLFK